MPLEEDGKIAGLLPEFMVDFLLLALHSVLLAGLN